MQSIPFYKVHPSGNMTCLLEGMELSPRQRQHIAAQVLQKNHIDGEQAGFIDIGQGILHMAGGEFCINATRALGLLMAQAAGCTEAGHSWQGEARVSGVDVPLYMEVSKVQAHMPHEVTLHMPLAPLPLLQEVAPGLVVVRMPGITHVLLDAHLHPFPVHDWSPYCAALRQRLHLEEELAVGCIWWKDIENIGKIGANAAAPMQALRIDPIVVVKNPPVECYENACGSGTLAVTLWLYTQKNQHSFVVQQPGGYLTVHFQPPLSKTTEVSANSELFARIGGPVYVVAEGTAYFSSTA